MHQQHQSQVKTWWGPVWRGLVVDKEARHYHQMRGAFWLFVYLVIHANRHTGQLYRKPLTIAAEMGINLRTIHRWLERLKRSGYITIKYRDRTQVIHIQKWRAVLSVKKKTN